MSTKINPSEISNIIQKKIDGFQGAQTEANVGEVISTADGIVQIYGLEEAMYGELLDFGEGTFGMALNLETDNVGIVIFSSDRGIKEGDAVRRTSSIVDAPSGMGLLGRVVDALGNPIDGTLTMVISHPLEELARQTIATLVSSISSKSAIGAQRVALDFQIYTSESL